MSLFNIQALQFLNCGPINLHIEAAEIIGLHGASGSGKSRLLRALADLDEHQGDVHLNSIEQKTISAHEWRKQVALLSAETYWWHDTVAEHFVNLSVQQTTQLGFKADISKWQVSRLSSGEKQRLGLLRLLENKPQVLLLDEPTANLDSKNVVLFEEAIQKYLEESTACAIWVSHDLEQIKRVSHRQFKMQDGVLINESVGN